MSVFPQPGDRYGKYRIDSLLGRGGMGAVYSATDDLLGRQVALKIVLPSLSDIDDYKARFAREAALLARVRSQHIVGIHEYGEHDEALFLVTELFPDGDLFQWLQRNGPLDPAAALSIVSRCAEALHDAHSVGVVHRDVKPSNILLWNRDGSLIPYLCDFGIAADAEAGITATGFVVGSFAYMAPERHTGGAADYRSDLYSLGCVLWAMLTGHPPFEGTDFQVMNAHINSPVPTYPGDGPLVAEVNEVLRRTMAKNPEDRYPSAAEMRREIAAHVDWTGGPTPGPKMVSAPPLSHQDKSAGTVGAPPLPGQANAPAPAIDEAPSDEAQVSPHTVARPMPVAPAEPPAAADDVPHATTARPLAPEPVRDPTVISPRREQAASAGAVPDLDELAATLARSTSSPETVPPAEASGIPDSTMLVAGKPSAPDVGASADVPSSETMLHRPSPEVVEPPAPLPPVKVPTRELPLDEQPATPPRRSRKGLALIAAAAVVVLGGGAGLAVALGSGGSDVPPPRDDGDPVVLVAPGKPTATAGYRSVTFRFAAPSSGQLEVSVDGGAFKRATNNTTVVASTAYGGKETCVRGRTTLDDQVGPSSQQVCKTSKAPTIRSLGDSACTTTDRAGRQNTPCTRYSLVLAGFPTGARLTGVLTSGGCQGAECRTVFSQRPDADGRVRIPAAVRLFSGNSISLTVKGGKASAQIAIKKN